MTAAQSEAVILIGYVANDTTAQANGMLSLVQNFNKRLTALEDAADAQRATVVQNGVFVSKPPVFDVLTPARDTALPATDVSQDGPITAPQAEA